MIIELIVGLLAGVTASMGLGGGFILMIYLTTIAGIGQIDAQGINLIFFLPISLISIIMHIKNKLIDKKPLLPIIGFGLLGACIGVLIAFLFPVGLISKLFAIILIALGLKELFHKKTKHSQLKDKVTKH
ncbi:MAG: sulfite exporter TauE/SafE family protein [Oscillospiraceae bacterium]|nr:sulfite exporter TauE/SafE family protein [Oscillospiraceae bacterium]